MKDVHQIFEEYFFSLIEPVKQSNYRSCAVISSDIIKYSEIIEFEDGVFIGEIFESIFMQITTELSNYQASEEEQQVLKTNILFSISSISKCYEEPDKTILYNNLKEMRLFTTRFQYQLRRQCKLKQQLPQFPFPVQLR
jgi:hypothetical protein